MEKDRAQALAATLLRMFNPDALLQAAANRSENAAVFVDTLSAELYSELHGRLRAEEWRLVAGVLARPGKKAVPDDTWKQFLYLFRSKLPRVNALEIAEVLADVLGTDRQPSAVLSFNAEVLLFALVNAATWERATDGGRRRPVKGANREYFDLVTRSISGRKMDRVPYILCHGVLPVPDQKRISPMVAVDKLVFSESDYLQLANNAFSWQASAFLDACTSRRVVFLGVSLSDPNMRRWLSWTHRNRVRELAAMSGYQGPSTFHFWLRTAPDDKAEQAWIEAAVQHLGVRVVWLDDWDDSAQTIRAMLRLQSEAQRPH